MIIPAEHIEHQLNQTIGNLYLPNYELRVFDMSNYNRHEIKIFWGIGKDMWCLPMCFPSEFFEKPEFYNYIKENVLIKLKPFLKTYEYNKDFEELLK